MATKQELEKRVAELETANDRLLLDLEWEKLVGQKLMAAMALASKKTKKEKRGTQQVKKQGNGTKSTPIPVDDLGQRVNTLGHRLNMPIIALLHREEYSKINAETLSAMTGGQFTKGRYQAHLSWLRRRGLL